MKQLPFYKYATWGLLVLNLSMVAFFFLTASPAQGVETGGKKAVDILKLDQQQHESFLLLVRQHIQLMDDFSNQQRKLLQPYFNSLIDLNKTNDFDSLLNQVQLLERKKIESVYQHFQDVKSILKPTQQENFAAFIDHAVKRILIEQNNQPPEPLKGN